MKRHHRIPTAACRRCGAVLSGASGLGTDDAPSAGDVVMCQACATVAVFDDRLRPRPPTDAELVELLADEDLVVALNIHAKHTARDGPTATFYACGCQTTAGADLFTVETCAPDCLLGRLVTRYTLELAAEHGSPVIGP